MPRQTRWHHSILFRSALAVLGVAVLVGALAIARTVVITDERTHQQAAAHLGELLDTVDSTVSVACFVEDTSISADVVRGLLKNSAVYGVIIKAGERELARGFRENAARAAHERALNARIARPIHSSFVGGRQVGEIHIFPNVEELERAAVQEVRVAAVSLALEIVAVVVAILLVVLHLIVRPIKAMSDHLHRMDATTGDRLRPPRGLAHTEVGHLASDINSLAERLVASLDDERNLRRQREIDEKKYRAIFDAAETGIFVTGRDGSVESANPALLKQVGLPADVAVGELSGRMTLGWRRPQRLGEMIAACLAANESVSNDLELAGEDGGTRWLNLSLSPVGGDKVQGLVTDVTKRRLAEDAARMQAVTDPLTGAGNRLGFEQSLQLALHGAALKPREGHFALMLIDLDGFKRVNEALGLPTGDKVLRIAAGRLHHVLKATDTIARLGGDKFGVLLPGIVGEEAARHVGERLVRELGETYDVDATPIKLRASIGIALFPGDGQEIPALLRSAELALDRAFVAGGNRFTFFDKGMAEAAQLRHAMETDMRLALRRNEFRLYYQPIIDLAANRLVGAEALIRWSHPERGLVPPDAFIPLAEETGLIVDIGLWALDAGCRQLAEWRLQDLDYYLSLNISGRQIPDGLPPSVLADAIRRHGIEPSRLVLEITEGVLMKDVSLAQQWLGTVRKMGMRIYLDDFGTGYSSLSYLKRFPVDTVKVDKSFVRDMGSDTSDRALIEAVVAMARSLGMQVVAEGVENESQLELLRQMNCRGAQGFHFSRPVPAEEFADAAARIARQLPRKKVAAILEEIG